MSVELHFNHHLTTAPSGQSLFECAETLGERVPTSCRKHGKCKECMVEVLEGMELLSPRVPAEKHLQGSFRLSCCTRVTAESGVIRCQTMRRGRLKVERHAFQLPGTIPLRIEPAVTREGGRVFIDGEEVDRRTGAIHGLALDLGTTTVVLRLLDLETGEIIGDASFENPQRFGGSDVMARIRYDGEDGTHVLQRTLAGYLSHAIQEFPVDPDSIYELVVSGNSTMRDLFFRLNVQPIGQNPYQSITEQEVASGVRAGTSVSMAARKLGLPINRAARAYGLPIISGHVGADAAACMLAVNLAEEDRLVAIMDIGTNTELILGNRNKIYAASCPAGPAFEGGKIICGMPGLPGAIERVRARGEGRFDLEVIDGVAPEGICGSGLVDLLSELLRTNRINTLGRFENGEDQVLLHEDEERRVWFHESDINELAQAKGANAAGLRILFENYGARFADLDVFYLAGGFGRYLDVEASRRIGLIPNLEPARILQVGNASIEGACLALLNRTKRAELENLVQRAVHCRLETHPGFFDYFVEGCQFVPVEDAPAIREVP